MHKKIRIKLGKQADRNLHRGYNKLDRNNRHVSMYKSAKNNLLVVLIVASKISQDNWKIKKGGE